MATPDPVLEQLDVDITRAQAELTRLHEMRSWWKTRQTEARTQAERLDRTAEKKPTVKEWVRKVLADGAHLGGAEIARAAKGLGWMTTSQKPAIVVRNACKDLEERGEVARDQHGKYFLLSGTPSGRGLFAVDSK